MTFKKEIGEIYRLKVPFESVYTSVFLIKTPNANVLMDCATTESDVKQWIIPALSDAGLSMLDVNYLVVSHEHGDHAGGLQTLLELNPNLKVIKIGDDLCVDELELYELKGHTLSCVGILDKKTGTLISCDGLQGAGVGKYRCWYDSREEYLKTIKKIKDDQRINNVLFSHEYEPWYKNSALGREQVEKCLHDCLFVVEKGE